MGQTQRALQVHRRGGTHPDLRRPRHIYRTRLGTWYSRCPASRLLSRIARVEGSDNEWLISPKMRLLTIRLAKLMWTGLWEQCWIRNLSLPHPARVLHDGRSRGDGWGNLKPTRRLRRQFLPLQICQIVSCRNQADQMVRRWKTSRHQTRRT